MLQQYLEKGFGLKEDLNCAEQILYGANHAYDLGLDPKSLHLAGGFGGGMAVEDACGIVTGAVMVFSAIYIDERARATPELKPVIAEFVGRFKKELGTLNCKELKANHCKEPDYCRPLIIKGAEILDQILKEQGKIQ